MGDTTIVIKGEWVEWAIRLGIIYLIISFFASFIVPIVTFVAENILRKLRDMQYKKRLKERAIEQEAERRAYNERELKRYFGDDYEILMKDGVTVTKPKQTKHGRGTSKQRNR